MQAFPGEITLAENSVVLVYFRAMESENINT